jgi:excinuclease UvrABC nuclease subunit
MHTCSRPCNNDINRSQYLEDVQDAIAFIEGRDEDVEGGFVQKMNDLAAETKFEEAEVIHRKLDKVRRARQEYKDTFFSVWSFNYIAVLASDSVSRCKIAFIRQGRIMGFLEYDVETLQEMLAPDLQRCFAAPPEKESGEAIYDEFCLAVNFIVDPLQSVDLLPALDIDKLPEQVIARLQQRKRKRKTVPEPNDDRSTCAEQSCD